MRLALLTILPLIFTLFPEAIIASNFINSERYHGWYWFEEKPKDLTGKTKEQQANKGSSSDSVSNISPQQAKKEVVQFKEELEDLRYVMLARPTPENIKAYRGKEQEMWNKAVELHQAWDLANLLYPEQRDLVNNPVNVHAVKAKREMLASENSEKIKQLAQEYELVLFFRSDCRYSQLFAQALKAFSGKYGFKVSSVSGDGKAHEYFPTAYLPQLIEKLGITAFPTVIAISNDAKSAFELIRGYVSISELEDYAGIAAGYLADLETSKSKGGRGSENNAANNQLARKLK
jgi:hypothetical protein